MRVPGALSRKVTVEDPSAGLLREMAELSIVDVDGEADSEAGPVLNLRQAAKRWGELHDVTVHHVLSSPVCFAAMLRHVATRESHPKSVIKHVGAMSQLMEAGSYDWDVARRWTGAEGGKGVLCGSRCTSHSA